MRHTWNHGRLGACALAQGVGDCPDSYAFDGKRVKKWSVECIPYGEVRRRYTVVARELGPKGEERG